MSLEDRADRAFQARQEERRARDDSGKQERKRMVQGLLDGWCDRMGIKEKPQISDLERIPDTSINSRIHSGYAFTVEGHKFYCDFYNGLVVYLDGFFDQTISSLDTLGEQLARKRRLS